jgi:hypothetical protein
MYVVFRSEVSQVNESLTMHFSKLDNIIGLLQCSAFNLSCGQYPSRINPWQVIKLGHYMILIKITIGVNDEFGKVV